MARIDDDDEATTVSVDWKKDLIIMETDQLETLLSAGQWGHHLLFSNEQISSAFGDAEARLAGMSKDTLDAVNNALTSLLGEATTLIEKRILVEEMTEEVRSVLIYLYFRILDQRMEEETPTVH